MTATQSSNEGGGPPTGEGRFAWLRQRTGDGLREQFRSLPDQLASSAAAMVVAIVVLVVLSILVGIVLFSQRFTAPGALAPGKWSWYFADGSTVSPSQTWYSILNPGTQVVLATVRLFGAEPGQPPREYTAHVNPGTQVRVPADKIMPGAVFGAEVTSDQPFFVERFTLGARDGTTSPGLKLAKDWYFPDAHTEGDYETWLLILNPGASVASGSITFLPVAGYCEPPIALRRLRRPD